MLFVCLFLSGKGMSGWIELGWKMISLECILVTCELCGFDSMTSNVSIRTRGLNVHSNNI